MKDLNPADFCPKCDPEHFEARMLEKDGSMEKVAIIPKPSAPGGKRRVPSLRIITKYDGEVTDEIVLRKGGVRALSASTLQYFQRTAR